MSLRETKNIYDSKFVENLFDRMSGSYERMNYITSFGFSKLWRRQCVKAIKFKEANHVVDLMTGMGECWGVILKKLGKNTKITALDFSKEMLVKVAQRKEKWPDNEINLLRENVFNNSIEDASADCVVSGFGIKTFSNQQLEQLASEIERILKVGGEFSLVEVSVPKNAFLRLFYMFYLRIVIPVLGKLFLGNPDIYKMLGVYTEKFNNSTEALAIFKKFNFEVEYLHFFFGCASGIRGNKTS